MDEGEKYAKIREFATALGRACRLSVRKLVRDAGLTTLPAGPPIFVSTLEGTRVYKVPAEDLRELLPEERPAHWPPLKPENWTNHPAQRKNRS